jgi:transposase
MILLTHETRILLSVAPADFRRGIDGFVAVCQNTLALQPRDGSVIVFINRARTMIRALSYDVNGYWLMTKRLSRGKFTGWPDGQRALSPTTARELRIILSAGAWAAADSTTHASTVSPASLASVPRSATIIRDTP